MSCRARGVPPSPLWPGEVEAMSASTSPTTRQSYGLELDSAIASRTGRRGSDFGWVKARGRGRGSRSVLSIDCAKAACVTPIRG